MVVDPAFAYLGGDSNSQKDVSRFMRELLNPLVKERNIGLMLVHHTNKPPTGREKDTWAGSDFAYVGAGSAEWINPCRAALAIRSIGSSDVFELIASKRGKRLGWKDLTGKLTDKQYIAHHGGEGVICWREATPEEVAEVEGGGSGKGRPVCVEAVEFVHCVNKNPGSNRQGLLEEFSRVTGKSMESAKRRLKECVESGYLREAGDSSFRRYQVTETGASEALKRPSLHDWGQKGQNRGQK